MPWLEPSGLVSDPGASRTPPRRKVSLDGLKPADFVAQGQRWPRGRLVSPWRGSVEEHGLTPELARRDEQAVRRLAALAIKLLDYTDAHGRSQAAVARALGVSAGTLSDFLTGKRFPTWILVERIRIFLSEEEPRTQRDRADQDRTGARPRTADSD